MIIRRIREALLIDTFSNVDATCDSIFDIKAEQHVKILSLILSENKNSMWILKLFSLCSRLSCSKLLTSIIEDGAAVHVHQFEILLSCLIVCSCCVYQKITVRNFTSLEIITAAELCT